MFEDFGSVFAEGGSVTTDVAFVLAEVDLDADLTQGAEHGIIHLDYRTHRGCLVAIEPFFYRATHYAGYARLIHNPLPLEGGAGAPDCFERVNP